MSDSTVGVERALPKLKWFWPNAHWILIAFFFLALLPSMFSPVIYHGDERFYTDGAIRMIQTGDYITPYYSSGLLRFRKPILTYWVIAASYKIFGISLFASRIPFLLAGCLVIWFTYKTSLSLLQREQEALLAAIVIFSNEQLFVLSTRSTPDILQTLFIAASLCGFANILFNRSKALLDYGYAYFGSALTVATKGLLGIFPVLYSFLISFIAKKRLAKPKDLINVPVMAFAAVIALFWFVLIFVKHGGSAINGFLGDQVTERLDGSKFYILRNAAEYLYAVLRHFFPWSVLLLLVFLKKNSAIKDFIREHKDLCLFIGAWCGILYLVFILGNLTRSRYLFPSYPLLAVLFSALLVEATHRTKSYDIIRKFEKILLLIGLIAGLLVAVLGAIVDARLVAGGTILFVFTLFLYLILINKTVMGGLTAMGVFLVLLYSTFFTFVKPVFSVSPVSSLVQCLDPVTEAKPIKVGSIDLPHEYQHQLTLFSDGAVWVAELPVEFAKTQLEEYPAIIVSESYRKELQDLGYQMKQCGYEYKKWRIQDVLGLMNSSDRHRFIDSMKQLYYVAFLKKQPSSLPSK